MDLEVYLRERRQLVNKYIENYFDDQILPGLLKESIVYSLSAGGKRIRPIICIAAYEACGGKTQDIVPYATALEFIHTYSLIHDDLPAMDNDDLRRGKPTNHKVFGEGMAILAGDGLLTEAFCLLSMNPSGFDTKLILQAMSEIALASGVQGMVGGQAADLIYETKEPDEETLYFIHTHKTASLIRASVKTGAILAGSSEEQLRCLSDYGERIGLAFQIIDDILDIEGETEVIGKPKGSDKKKDKMTYPKLFGIENSRHRASRLINEAIDVLAFFDEKADPLREIARYLLQRKS